MAGTFNLDCQLVTKERQENVHYQIAKVGHFYAGNSKRKGEREREREKGGRERKGGGGGRGKDMWIDPRRRSERGRSSV